MSLVPVLLGPSQNEQIIRLMNEYLFNFWINKVNHSRTQLLSGLTDAWLPYYVPTHRSSTNVKLHVSNTGREKKGLFQICILKYYDLCPIPRFSANIGSSVLCSKAESKDIEDEEVNSLVTCDFHAGDWSLCTITDLH